MSNKNIFVFGGTGSIGKSLSKKLKSNNYDPIIISRNETELKQLGSGRGDPWGKAIFNCFQTRNQILGT